DTRAQVNGDVSSASLLVKATGTYTVLATSKPISVGIIAGAGVAAVAEITGIVEALIGERAENAATLNVPTVNVGSGFVKVKASSTMTATAVADGFSVGAVTIGVMLPTAHVDGKTRAYVRDGVSMVAGSLTILATQPDEVSRVLYTATATSKVIGVGLISGAGVLADATVSGSVEAYAGAPTGMAAGGAAGTGLAISGGATTITALSTMTATTRADGTGAGLASANIMLPSATVSGFTTAYAGQGADLSGTTVTVTADGDYSTRSTTIAIAVGLGAGNFVNATAITSGVVDAHLAAGVGAA